MPRQSSAGRTTAAVAAAALAASCLAACQRQDETLPRRLQEATAQLGTCQKDLGEARAEVANLKQQLATALTAPARVQLTDPEIIQLVASKGGPPPAEGAGGGLDPQQASALVLRGAQGLQGCYERALKNNVSLQKQAGVGLLLAITVKPSGAVEKVDVTPNVDRGMSECIRGTAARWKFPAFSGRAVTIEQKVTLTPKT